MDELKRTPLYEKHLSHKGRMVPFGGWEMPVQYSGIMEEHKAVRSRVGLFDVSHMGEFEIRGPRLVEFVNYLTANDATKLTPGKAQYSMLLNERGGTIDDIIVYRVNEERALVVVNAGNIDKDWAHVAQVASGFEGVTVENHSDDYALLALQGPKAEALLNDLVEQPVTDMGYYTVRENRLDGHEVVVARTGYTGEDGFEIFIKCDNAAALWDKLMNAGAAYGIVPAGLGARDTLRLEASMPLYGHELDEDTSPIEAGLGFFVAKEGDYIGAARQRELREKGVGRKLVMLKIMERGIAREGHEVLAGTDKVVGKVTSGSMAPHLGYAIAQAYVDPEYSNPGTTLNIDVRGRHILAEVVKRPFYKREQS